jgi:hypothetical protein
LRRRQYISLGKNGNGVDRVLHSFKICISGPTMHPMSFRSTLYQNEN